MIIINFFLGIFRFIGGAFWWIFYLLITLIIADVIGNFILLITGGWKQIRLHSRYFFMARDKWDKKPPLSSYMYKKKA